MIYSMLHFICMVQFGTDDLDILGDANKKKKYIANRKKIKSKYLSKNLVHLHLYVAGYR